MGSVYLSVEQVHIWTMASAQVVMKIVIIALILHTAINAKN